MDLIRDINNQVREKDAVEAAIEQTKKTEPKLTAGKPISDYLNDIQQKNTEKQ